MRCGKLAQHFYNIGPSMIACANPTSIILLGKICLASIRFILQLQVLFTSHIDKYYPCQQLAAPFKAANSRQVQTCNIPFTINTKKLQTGLHWF